jgi:transposase
MSAKEHERAVVFARVVAGELRLREAAELVRLSERQAKRVLARFRSAGRAGLVHGNVGQPSNRARPAEERKQILELVRAEFGGRGEPGPGQRFGPTLAAEHLEEEFGIVLAARTAPQLDGGGRAVEPDPGGSTPTTPSRATGPFRGARSAGR